MWKSWPNWVRGGVISVVVELIIFSLSFVYFLFCFRGFGDAPEYCTSINFLNYPERFFFFNSLINSLIANIVFYIILGCLFGWLYGKIRNRKEGQGSQDNFQ